MPLVKRIYEQCQKPQTLLLLMASAVPLSFATWQALLNNFVVERASFSGQEIGMLHSLREIPGLMAFTAIFVLLLLREQRLALVALLLLGGGTAITGLFPSAMGLYVTTVLMSLGFHYYETIQTSLALQWLDKSEAPQILGKIIAAASFSSLCAYLAILLCNLLFPVDFIWLYAAGGGLTICIALLCWALFPKFPQKVVQHKKLIFRKRYWLFYGLTFLAGARRQIFVVFAGFMMVEKFGYHVSDIVTLLLINHLMNLFFAPKIGRLIHRLGEKNALTLEYLGLTLVFISYAFVENAIVAGGLYVIDHLFFAMAIAIKTYFQKIADPADIASSSGVAFSINHIAAVALPAPLGILWINSPSAVFLVGASLAACSLGMARLVPHEPKPGNEWSLRIPPSTSLR